MTQLVGKRIAEPQLRGLHAGFGAPDEIEYSELVPARPYTGLRPFETDDWPVFCGRKQIVQDLIDVLALHHTVFVIGASASGKSSLVRAGLLATVEGRHGTLGVRWRTLVMRPGGQPFNALADAVMAQRRPAHPHAAGWTRVGLSLRLEHADEGLGTLLPLLDIQRRENLILLVDQFEEIFRFDSVVSKGERERFVQQIVRVAQEGTPGLYIALTMRAEYIGDCAKFRGLPDLINRTHYLVPPMDEKGLRGAILDPARLLGGEVEPKLVDRLIKDVAEDPDHLPILQHSLAWMWTNEVEATEEAGTGPGSRLLTLDRYLELKGGDPSLLSRHCEQIFSRLADWQQSIAQVMFRRMVEVEDRWSRLRRPTRCGTVAALAGVELDDVDTVVAAFAQEQASFVYATERPVADDTTLDITHESLIRQWTRLDGWVRAERKSLQVLKDLERAARRHEEGGRLWAGAELASALEWRDRERPTKEWARRYDCDYASAMHFLRLSEDEESARKRAEEHAQEIEARRHIEEARRASEQRARHEAAVARQAKAEQEVASARAEAAEIARQAAIDRMQVSSRALQRTRVMACLAAVAFLVAGCFALYNVVIQKNLKAAVNTARARGHELTTALETAEDRRREVTQASKMLTKILVATGRAQLVSDGAAGSILISLEFQRDKAGAPELEALAYAGLARLREEAAVTSKGTQVMSVAACQDGTIMSTTPELLEIWSAEGRRINEYPLGHSAGMVRASLSADCHSVLVGSPMGDGVLLSWDGTHLEPTPRRVGFGELSSDGTRAIAGGWGRDAVLWDTMKNERLWPAADAKAVQSWGVAMAPDGLTFALGTKEGIMLRSVQEPDRVVGPTLQLPMAGTGDELPPGSPTFFSMALNPAIPQMVAATGLNGLVVVWVPGQEQPVLLPGHDALVFRGAFSPDGRWLATAGEDRSIRLWSVADIIQNGGKAQARMLRGHTSSVFAVAFNADSTGLISGSSDRTVRFWRLEPVLPERVSEMPRQVQAPQISRASKPTKIDSETWEITPDAGVQIRIKTPFDFGEPLHAAIDEDRKFLLIAPNSGRPLLYRITGTDVPAPVAELGELRREWDGVFFDKNCGGADLICPAGRSGDNVYRWQSYKRASDLLELAEQRRPLRDGTPVTLQPNRKCMLGLEKFEVCASLPASTNY